MKCLYNQLEKVIWGGAKRFQREIDESVPAGCPDCAAVETAPLMAEAAEPSVTTKRERKRTAPWLTEADIPDLPAADASTEEQAERRRKWW
mgnify:FL=1